MSPLRTFRLPLKRSAALAGATVVALVAGIALAPSGSATVRVNAQLSSTHAWPKMKPQGARWFSSDERVAKQAEYFLTSPRQGSHQDRMNGSARYYAIRAYQQALHEQGVRVTVNGYFGTQMRDAVRTFQARHNRTVAQEHRLGVTGRIGYETARAILAPTINRMAKKHGVPAKYLCGHVAWESGLDGRAVGPGGTDYGLAQMSRRYHQADYTLGQAYDKNTAVDYMARRDARAFRTYGDWKYAMVSYWSPKAASDWKRTGQPIQHATDYSNGVLDGCGADHLFT